MREVTLDQDEGNRPETTLEGLAELQPVLGPEHDHHRRQCQRSCRDGASACVVMEASLAAEARACSRSAAMSAWRSPAPSPTRWASARSSRCPSCSSASASRWTTSACGSSTRRSRCRCSIASDKLGIPDDRLNVNGGAISIGHPYGMIGRAADRPRADRGQAARREICRRDDVRRRRHGRGGAVRGAISCDPSLWGYQPMILSSALIACSSLILLLVTSLQEFRDQPGISARGAVPARPARRR